LKTLIVTADDFGNSVPINEAIEAGHKAGVLSATSLMVGGPAFEDAVARAKLLPRLGVGLHLTLVDGNPVLPAAQVPDLVGSDGRIPDDAIGYGVKLFFSPAMRAQVRAEIIAQFERFRATGLALDHVNGHQHFHMHPAIVSVLADVLPRYGSPPVRVPFEPFGPSYGAMRDRAAGRMFTSAFYTSQTFALSRTLKRLNIPSNTASFGINDTGHMTEARVLRYLHNLPEGTTELYLHPATRRWEGPDNLPASYEAEEEYRALISPNVAAKLQALGIKPVSFQTAFAGRTKTAA
jgi:hopanoid biosynthesis associated protein HpnK